MKSKKPMESTPKLRILTLRDQRVLLDADLALLYGVETRALNQAVKRNFDRFPPEFVFQLTDDEALSKSQTVTSKSAALTSQIVMSKPGRGGRRHRPYAFTERGALQAANVLNSPQAVQMSLYVIRAFVKMREELTANATILKRLAEIDKSIFLQDSALRDIYRKLLPLLAPPPEPQRRRIGFNRDTE
ncbi:MAG TPA: ORF6N domain-containing protein [Verrucomicrobiae bacterium]